MTKNSWQFGLDGEDVCTLVELFKTGVDFLKDEKGVHLKLALPYGTDNVHDALEEAKQHIARLNGIARAYYDNWRPVSIGGITLIDPDTGQSVGFIVGEKSLPIPIRFGHGGAISDADDSTANAPSSPFGDRVLEQAEKNTCLEKTLYLYGALEHNWRELYLVFEVIAEAHGGKKCYIKKFPVLSDQIDSFTGTVNSFNALGIHSRHAKEDKYRMKQTLQDAQIMIRELLRKWIKELENSRP